MPEKAPKAIPDGMHTVTIHLRFNGNCKEAIQFYEKAFSTAMIAPPVETEDGSIMHAMLKIGDSNIMMADAMPKSYEQGPTGISTVSMWIYIDECDALYQQAVDAGCEVMWEMMDAFWGDRMGKVKDPYGHCWAIASHKWVLTPEEMEEHQEEWLKSMAQ